MSQAKPSVRKTAEDAGIVGDSLGPQGTMSGGGGGPSGPEDLADLATGVASDIAGAAVQQGRQLFETARGQATGFADQRKDSAAQSIADLASSLRETGKAFDDRPNIASFVGSAADGLEHLAGGIRDRSFADLYGEVEDYARQRPMTVAAVAVVAGFALARFIKSSAADLSETSAARRASGQSRSRSSSAARPRSTPVNA